MVGGILRHVISNESMYRLASKALLGRFHCHTSFVSVGDVYGKVVEFHSRFHKVDKIHVYICLAQISLILCK